MKTKNTFIRMLWLAIILGLSVTSAIAQQMDLLPKGQFLDAYTKPQSYVKIDDVYSADATKLSAEWRGNGFSLQTVNGGVMYTTGQYAANAQLSATSPGITLPAVSNNEKLILQVSQSYETETRYDFISVQVKVNGSATGTEVYRRSGKSDLVEDYINLTAYAGKQIELSFLLTTDGSEQGNGWQIANLELYRALKNSTGANTAQKTKSVLRAGAPGNYTLDILDVNTEAFPDAIFVEFTVKDAGGSFVSDLDVDDFTLLSDYGQRYGCHKLLKVSETVKEAVDIVFLVDNSASMYDDIQKVSNAIDNLLDAIEADGGNVRVALARFGDYPSCPNYANKTEYQGKFFYSLATEKTQFLSQIWSYNTGTLWGYEPYYEVLNWASNQNFDYRQNAKKVFIMIGDEKVNDGINNIQCDNSTASTLTEAGVANTLSQKGIQTFFIVDESYAYAEFDLIASQTGGLIEDIYAQTYDDVLDAFGQAIVEKYIMRFCLDVDPENFDPTIHNTVTITYNDDPSATDTETYYPVVSPSIVRSLATQALDNVSQLEGVAVPIEVTVIQNGNTLDYITFYYKQYDESTYHSVTKNLSEGTINGDDVTFSFTVPANTVSDPNVSYYFTASTHIQLPNGIEYQNVSSPPNNQDVFAWTFPVLPNQAPSITNVTISDVKPCSPITICANVTDNTQYLAANPKLMYRVNKTPSMYEELEMLPSSSGSNTYCATIEKEFVQETDLEWYIVAEDNYGTLGWHGDPASPNFINTTYQSNPALGGHPIDLIVTNYANVQFGCLPMESTDQLAAYFINSCGDEQLAGTGVWNGVDNGFNLTVYGDSDPNDGYKDGFENGDPIIFKLIRNGVDYSLTNTLTYNQSAYYLMISTAIGAGSPVTAIKGNGVDILHNSTTPSTYNNTDFGATSSSSPVSKQFSIQNVGCEVLEIKEITVSDDANFMLNPLPANNLLAPGSIYNFNISYLGLANATATVTVNTNAATQNPYRFDIKGTSGIVDPCAGIVLVPNQVPNFISPTLTLPVADDNTYVYAGLMSPNGTLLQVLMMNAATQAGTYTLTVHTAGLPSGVYSILVYRGSDVCSDLKLIIL